MKIPPEMRNKQIRAWFVDLRSDPFDSNTDPDWKPYDDDVSLIIEFHFLRSLKEPDAKPEVQILPNYAVDVKKCLQIHTGDRSRKRPVKRGELNKRPNRPSNWRMGGEFIALKGKYNAIEGMDGKIEKERWLGLQFWKSLYYKKWDRMVRKR